MTIDDFVLKMKQGESVEQGDYVYFGHKVNDTVNVVYRRGKNAIDNVVTAGYVEKGRDVFVQSGEEELEFNNLEDYDKISRDLDWRQTTLAKLIANKVGETCVELYGKVASEERDFTYNELENAKFYVDKKDGIIQCAKDEAAVMAESISVRDLRKKLFGCLLDYLDKGLEVVNQAAKDYMRDEKITKTTYEVAIYKNEVIKDFFLNPDKHLYEWLGLEILRSVEEKAGIRCEYTDYETGEKHTCLFEDKMEKDNKSFLEGNAKVNRKRNAEYTWLRFIDVNRIFYGDNCIYNKEREVERIKSNEFRNAIKGLIEAVKKTGADDVKWYGKKRIKDMKEGSLVYLPDSGHFGVVVNKDMTEKAMEKGGGLLKVVLDDGGKEYVWGSNWDSFMIRDEEMNKELEGIKDFIEYKYLGRYKEDEMGRSR